MERAPPITQVCCSIIPHWKKFSGFSSANSLVLTLVAKSQSKTTIGVLAAALFFTKSAIALPQALLQSLSVS